MAIFPLETQQTRRLHTHTHRHIHNPIPIFYSQSEAQFFASNKMNAGQYIESQKINCIYIQWKMCRLGADEGAFHLFRITNIDLRRGSRRIFALHFTLFFFVSRRICIAIAVARC